MCGDRVLFRPNRLLQTSTQEAGVSGDNIERPQNHTPAELTRLKETIVLNALASRRNLRATSICLILAGCLVAAQERPTEPRNPDDVLREDLQAHGTRVDRARVVVWFAADILPRADEERWADMLSKGIDD